MHLLNLKNSIGRKFLLMMCIVFIIPYAILGVTINSLISKNVLEEGVKKSSQIMAEISNSIYKDMIENSFFTIEKLKNDDRILGLGSEVRSYVTQQDIDNSGMITPEERDVIKIFKNYKDSDDRINFIFLGLENGDYIEYPLKNIDEPYDPRVRPWYEEAMVSGETKAGDPYLTTLSNELVMSFTSPITLSDGTKGVIGYSMKVSDITGRLIESGSNLNSHYILINENDKILVSPIMPQWVLKTIDETENSYLMSLDQKQDSFSDFYYSFGEDNKKFLMNVYEHPLSHWRLISIYSEKSLMSLNSQITRLILILFVLFLVLTLTAVYFNITKITEPLMIMSGVIDGADKYDFSLNEGFVEITERNDEIGMIGKAVLNLIMTLRKIVEFEVGSEKDQELLSSKDNALLEGSNGIRNLSQIALSSAAQKHLEKENVYNLLFDSRRELQKSQDRLQMVLDLTDDAFWDLDITKNKFVYNTKFCDILEESYSQGSISFEGFLDAVDKDDRVILSQDIDDLKDNIYTNFELEIKLTSKNEMGYIWYLTRARVVDYDSNGQVSRIIGTLTDINESKRQNERLRYNNDELEIMIGERTQELLALNEELIAMNQEIVDSNITLNKEINERKIAEEKLEVINKELQEAIEMIKRTQDSLIRSEKLTSLSMMVAGVAHEVNTPLGISVTISSYIQKISEDLYNQFVSNGLTKGYLKEYLDDVSKSLKMLVTNLEKASLLITSFKNISADQTSEEMRPFDVKKYTEEIIISLMPNIKNSNVNVNLECPEKVMFKSYPGAYSQILTNLIMNSLIHAFENKDSGNINILVTEIEGGIKVRFSDDGKGIPEEEINKIFDPFFTTKRGQGGTGLGLYLVYNLVTQQFEGEISHDSQVSDGTTFDIILNGVKTHTN